VIAQIYVPDMMVAPRKPPPPRDAVTEWNWRQLDEHEQAAVAEGMRRDYGWGLQLIAGRTS
jgi:hypothetical protein